MQTQADRADTGMPQEWQKILDDNGITRAEQEENPDKVSWRVTCWAIADVKHCRSLLLCSISKTEMRRKVKKTRFGKRWPMLDLLMGRPLHLRWVQEICRGKVVKNSCLNALSSLPTR